MRNHHAAAPNTRSYTPAAEPPSSGLRPATVSRVPAGSCCTASASSSVSGWKEGCSFALAAAACASQIYSDIAHMSLLICPVLSCAIPWHSNGARTPSTERIYCSSALPAMICQSVSSCFSQSGLVVPLLRRAGRLQHCPQHSPTGLRPCVEGRPPATLTSLKAQPLSFVMSAGDHSRPQQ